MTEWFNLLVNNGIAVFIVAYFCYMNYKYNQTILSSLEIIKEAISDLRKENE